MLQPLLVCLALLAGAGPSSAGPAATTLRVGMYTRQPPWAFVPGLTSDYRRPAPSPPPWQLAKLVGFDVDVMNALGQRLGARMVVVPIDWNQLETGLLKKRYDLILSGWTPSLKTPEAIAASQPYCDWGLLIVVRADNRVIQSPADLEGARVGHLGDPAVERALGSMGRHRFLVRDNEELLFSELSAGALDAVITDSLYVRWRAAQEPGLRIVGEPLNRLGYHVGVRSEDAALLARVNAAVRDVVASGEIAAIRSRWEQAQGGVRTPAR